MNKKHVFYALLALFFALPASVLASFDRDLSYGSRGTDVSDLQTFLTDQGIYRAPVTGNFYNLTKAAVIEFQNTEGIAPAAGYFGPLTRKKANSLVGRISTPAQISMTPTPTPSSTATGNTTIIRIPNGPVVEIDASGKIVRWIEGWPHAQDPKPTITPVTNQASNPLAITPGSISTTHNSAYLSWTTSQPFDSKIFWSLTSSNMTQIANSESGKSTQHIARMSGLTPETNYSYTIEAIVGQDVNKYAGTLKTLPPPRPLNVTHAYYRGDGMTVQYHTNFPANFHLTQLTRATNGNIFSLDGPANIARKETDETFLYQWTPFIAPPAGTYKMKIVTTDGDELISEPFVIPNVGNKPIIFAEVMVP